MYHVQQSSPEATRDLLQKICDHCPHHMGAHQIIGSGGLQPFQVGRCLAEGCECKDFENPDVKETPGVSQHKGG